MRQTYLKATLSGLLLTALLAPAYAQTPSGAKETITIKSEAEKKESAPASAAPAAGISTPKMVNTRDPFVQGSVTDEGRGAVRTSTKLKPKEKKEAGNDAAAEAAKKAAAAEAVIAAPQVNVSGIVLSHSGNRAILVSPNQTYIVKTGDKLGDYRVSEIGTKHVTFKYKDKAFKLKMEDEFSAKK